MPKGRKQCFPSKVDVALQGTLARSEDTVGDSHEREGEAATVIEWVQTREAARKPVMRRKIIIQSMTSTLHSLRNSEIKKKQQPFLEHLDGSVG